MPVDLSKESELVRKAMQHIRDAYEIILEMDEKEELRFHQLLDTFCEGK
jgi:hypothetical protein